MTLAANVAALISSNLRYTDGTPVECVIADGTIGRVAESAACAEKFEREGVGGTITVTSCWCYGSETMDMNPYWPKASGDSTERSVPGRFTSPRCLPRTHRRAFLLSEYTVTMSRISMTTRSRRMWPRRFSALPVALSRWRR